MNNDLISREALKKAIEQGEGFSWDNYGKDDLCVRKKYIDNAPTVEPDEIQAIMKDYLVFRCEPDRPQGKWIEGSSETGALGIKYTWVRCNQCGWNNSLVIPKNFCPNCGADMRGGNNETN